MPILIPVQDPKSTRTTLLGVGFREREQAFDFKNTLNDYVRYISRMDLASQMAACAVEDEEQSSTSSSAATVSEICCVFAVVLMLFVLRLLWLTSIL